MRNTTSVLMMGALLALAPVDVEAQRGDAAQRARTGVTTRDRDGSWDWERGRDRDRDVRRRDDGWGRGRDNDRWRAYERRQRDFERRTRHWNRAQWTLYRNCEADLLRRVRRDRNNSRWDELRDRERVRDICERRVRDRYRW